MTKQYILYLLLVLFSCSSKDRAQDNSRQTLQDTVELPQSFSKAYHLFHSDSAVQLEMIQFPLSGKSKSGNDTIWTAEDWQIHHAFDPRSKIFHRSFQPLGSALIIEHIIAPKLELHMQRRWKKENDSWKLIYYKELQK